MNMLRKFILPGLLAIACTAVGQNYNAEKVDRPNTKKINIGIKAGFNSSMFMVSELKIKDVTIDEVQNNYKIGYFRRPLYAHQHEEAFHSAGSVL